MRGPWGRAARGRSPMKPPDDKKDDDFSDDEETDAFADDEPTRSEREPLPPGAPLPGDLPPDALSPTVDEEFDFGGRDAREEEDTGEHGPERETQRFERLEPDQDPAMPSPHLTAIV